MQSVLRWSMTLLFIMATHLMAQSPAPAKPAVRKKNTVSQTQQQIQALHDLVTFQQQQIETQHQQLDLLKSQLQQLLDATEQAAAEARKGQGSADQAQAAAAQAEHSASSAQRTADQAAASAGAASSALAAVNVQEKEQDKRLTALGELLGRFRFSGDMRVRGEGFFQDGSITRNRARIRVRLGLDGKLKTAAILKSESQMSVM